MKNISLILLVLVFIVKICEVNAQAKVGSNPINIIGNKNLEVEASNGKKV